MKGSGLKIWKVPTEIYNFDVFWVLYGLFLPVNRITFLQALLLNSPSI